MHRTACLLLVLLTPTAHAADAPAVSGAHELIYCAHRMTHEEREAYRAKMRAARSSTEKDAIRAAHRAEQDARAAARNEAGECPVAGRHRHGGQGR